MKLIPLVLICFMLSSLSFAATKGKAKNKARSKATAMVCAKNQKPVSCAGVKGAKNKSICWKGKISKTNKVKMCKATAKKAKAKATAKRSKKVKKSKKMAKKAS